MLVNKIRRSLLDAEGEWRGSSETQVNLWLPVMRAGSPPESRSVHPRLIQSRLARDIVQSLGLKLAFDKIKEM